MLKQPKGFGACFIAASSDTLSFYGVMSSILMLLLTVFHQSSARGYEFYGQLTAIGFVTPVLGGALADRLYRRTPATLVGLIFILLGSLCCTMMKLNALMWGFSFMMIGVGLMKSNNMTLVGMLYPSFSKEKEKGITLVYMGMNAGAVLGPLAAAILSYLTQAYQVFFIFTAAIFVVPIILLIFRYRYLCALESRNANPQNKVIPTPVFLAISVAVVGIAQKMLVHPLLFNFIFGAGLVMAGLYIVKIVYHNIPTERKKIFFILILCFFNIFYYVCSIQMSGALLLFSLLYSNGILKFNLPMQWLTSIEPLSIIIMIPLILRWSKNKISHAENIDLTLRKFFLSLLSAGIAYLFFYLASRHLTHPGFFIVTVLIGIILIGFGELTSTPPLYNAISNLTEEKYRGFFMGLTWFIIAVASYFSSMVAMVMVGNEDGPKSLGEYPKLFMAFAVMALIAAAVFRLVLPRVRRLVALPG